MTLDYILEISYAADRQDIDNQLDTALFLSASLGSTLQDDGARAMRSVWFGSPEDRAAARELLADLAPELELRNADRERIDWLARYEQSLVAIPIGKRFVVAPDRALIDDPERLPIVVPQEQAFGTGSHETTALCLEMLESLDLDGAVCADVGTGSGILAIAMSMLGAKRVVAFDNDPEALPVALVNLDRNGVSPRSVRCFCGSVEALGDIKFDVVTMNILPDVIALLLPDAAGHLKPGARLILSGIVLPRRDEVVAAAECQGLKLVAEKAAGEWWCGMVRRVKG